MATLVSQFVSGPLRIPASVHAGQSGIRAYYNLLLGQQLTGNIIDMIILPANHVLLDCILDADALAASALTLDVGILSGTPGDAVTARTMGAEIFAASTIGVAGGVVRPTLKTAFRIADSALDRSIGVKVLLQGATPATGLIGLTVFYAPNS